MSTLKRSRILLRESFWYQFHVQKGEVLFGLVWKIISSTKRSNTKLLDYVGFIINELRKRRVGVL